MPPSRDTWNERYRNTQQSPAEPDAIVIEAAKLARSGVALDIACGLGRNAVYLAQQGFQVLALDISEEAISRLAKRFVNLEAHVADLEHTNLPPSDLIVNTRYLQRSLFPQIRAALTPGGIFAALIAMPDDDPQVKPMNPDYLLQPGELRLAFADLEILREDERKSPGHRRMQQFLARNGSAR